MLRFARSSTLNGRTCGVSAFVVVVLIDHAAHATAHVVDTAVMADQKGKEGVLVRAPPPRSEHSLRIAVAFATTVLAVAAALVVALSAFASTGAQTLRSSSFTTAYPAGWRVRVQRKGGAVQYFLSSTGAPISNLGVGPAGTVAVSVGEVSASQRQASESASTLLGQIVGAPVKAVTVIKPPSATGLDGTQTATFACTYTYHGVPNVQVDVVARRGKVIIVIESDAEPSKASQASAALTMIVDRWHWHQ